MIRAHLSMTEYEQHCKCVCSACMIVRKVKHKAKNIQSLQSAAASAQPHPAATQHIPPAKERQSQRSQTAAASKTNYPQR